MKTAATLRHIIEWKDLRTLSRWQVVQELLLPVPWLVGSLAAAAYEWYALALPCSFMFFLTGLRQVHGAFHYSIRVTTLLVGGGAGARSDGGRVGGRPGGTWPSGGTARAPARRLAGGSGADGPARRVKPSGQVRISGPS